MLIRDNRAFTLVEIMIAIVISSAVISGAYMLLSNSYQIFNDSQQKITFQQDINFLSHYITEQLRYATKVKVLNDISKLDHANYSYLLLSSDQSQVIHYPQNSVGVSIPRTVVSSNNKYKYNLLFSKEDAEDKYVNFQLGIDKLKSKFSSAVAPSNLTDSILGDKEGIAIAYVSPNSFVDDVYKYLFNKFWYDWVSSVNDDTVISAGDSTFDDPSVNGGELSFNITGTSTTGGGLLFTKLDDTYFKDKKGDIDSFSISVDAKINQGNGFGVLLRGGWDEDDKEDYGYLFQFDPGAKGFMLRKIHNGYHHDTGIEYVGADVDRNAPNGYMAVYTPADIRNDETGFNLSDWNKRYTTKIKVQTQLNIDDGNSYTNKTLIIRVKIIDQAGNESKEMWFGDFDKVYLNGTKFTGKQLDWEYFFDWEYSGGHFGDGDPYDGKLPGRYIALRSWGGSYSADFYEIKIGEAEPGVKQVNRNIDKITLTFDEPLDLDQLPSTDNFILDEGWVTKVEKGENLNQLVLYCDNVNCSELTYTKDGQYLLKDKDGNEVEKFSRTFNK
ncbi:PilW family protein [Orenia metallireducens]|uniref:PilW family protein n=1 Tax=Orenia metallireducens TaxID=1413210 RepID=UPI0011B253DF|nr:prepilin-type N-terminal cleavage/methylation domain-containing protein [Orenia metallireducens]